MDGKPFTYTSRIDDLPEAVDPELFMLGMLFAYPRALFRPTSMISPKFFGMAVGGTTHSAGLDAELQRVLKDPAVDVWNRHRAAIALHFLRRYSDPEVTAREHAASVLELPGVPAATAAHLRWVK